MTDEKLSPEELEEQNGEPLPPREVMSIVDPGEVGGGFYTLPVEPPDSEDET